MNDWYRLPGFNQPMSCMTHLVGALVFLVLAIVMLVSAWRDRARFFACGVFACSVVVLLSMSSVFHMFEPGFAASRVFIRLDVAAIFVLIAATFTPVHVILFRGWHQWGILAPLWVVAVTGVTLRTIFFDSLPIFWGTMIFLAMGWIGLFSTILLYKQYGRRPAIPMIAGGILYTIGAIGDAMNWPIIIDKVWGPHVTFHLFVLAALGVHWSLVTRIADGSLTRDDRIIFEKQNGTQTPNESESENGPSQPEQRSVENRR